jgi:hypothetical protein
MLLLVTGYGETTVAMHKGGRFDPEPVHVGVIEPSAPMLEPPGVSRRSDTFGGSSSCR